MIGSARFPDFAALAHASENEVLHAWQGLGYYARARNLRAPPGSCKIDMVEFFPRQLDAMRELPGVGRTPPTPSPPSRSISPFPLSKPTPLVFLPGCSTSIRQSILRPGARDFGIPLRD